MGGSNGEPRVPVFSFDSLHLPPTPEVVPDGMSMHSFLISYEIYSVHVPV